MAVKPGAPKLAHGKSDTPWFVGEPERRLTWEERALVEEVLKREAPGAKVDVGQLRVVGRCGCGKCPTVFFLPPDKVKQNEREIATYTGVDDEDGITGVALWTARGQLSQLDFWSVDGHEPWSAPSIATLKKL